MMNDGSSSNSTSATSGAPLPAFSALFSAVYSGSPAPGSSSVTQMPGWVLLNSVTARFMPGTQAQNVSWVVLEEQDAPPASTDADGLALALPPLAPPDGVDGAPVPQAASVTAAAAPASQASDFLGSISGLTPLFPAGAVSDGSYVRLHDREGPRGQGQGGRAVLGVLGSFRHAGGGDPGQRTLGHRCGCVLGH